MRKLRLSRASDQDHAESVQWSWEWNVSLSDPRTSRLDHQAYSLSVGEAQHTLSPSHAHSPLGPFCLPLQGPLSLRKLPCWLTHVTSPFSEFPHFYNRAWPPGTFLHALFHGPSLVQVSLTSIIRLKVLWGQELVRSSAALPRAKAESPGTYPSALRLPHPGTRRWSQQLEAHLIHPQIWESTDPHEKQDISWMFLTTLDVRSLLLIYSQFYAVSQGKSFHPGCKGASSLTPKEM